MTAKKKIGLLLGAGFSYDLGMPLASELTEVLLEPFNQQNTRHLARQMAHLRPYGESRPVNERALSECFDILLNYKADLGQNYEALLAQLESRSLQHDQVVTQSDRDSAHYVLSFLYEQIYNVLSLYQRASYDLVYPCNRRWYSNLPNLLSSNETWVFSLNHDLYLECLALDLEIPITYGAVTTEEFPLSNLDMQQRVRFSSVERGQYDSKSPGFFHEAPGINLIKLHGGLGEYKYRDEGIICNLDLNQTGSLGLIATYEQTEQMAYYVNGLKASAARDRFITNLAGECDVITKAMLTGGRKYSSTAKPKDGEEKLSLFDQVLGELDQLTVIGYGFADKHVNFRITNAMARYDKLSLWIVDPYRNSLPDCLDPFDYDSRIRCARCSTTLWMDYCKSNRWDVVHMDSLKQSALLRQSVRARVASSLVT
jgi:hypothetical protein